METTDTKKVKIETLKKGDFFRLNGQRVYVFLGYNRSINKYEANRFDDVNHFINKKKGTLVEIGFDF